MQKWEYIHVVSNQIGNEWKVSFINGKLPVPPTQGDIYSFLNEYGNNGWEVIYEYQEVREKSYSFYSVFVSTLSGNWNANLEGTKKSNTEILQYLTKNYGGARIVGVIPSSSSYGLQNFEILFEQEACVEVRRFTLKRPLQE